MDRLFFPHAGINSFQVFIKEFQEFSRMVKLRRPRAKRANVVFPAMIPWSNEELIGRVRKRHMAPNGRMGVSAIEPPAVAVHRGF